VNLEEIPFGLYREISPNIVEVIVDEGIEIDEDMQLLAESVLFEKYKGESYCLLVNRKNNYSHAFSSMQKIPEFRNLVSIAIVVYSKLSKLSAETHQNFQSNTQIFHEVTPAHTWLNEILNPKK
jgi:hypothetical protein